MGSSAWVARASSTATRTARVQGDDGRACRQSRARCAASSATSAARGSVGPQLGARLLLPGQVALVAPLLARGSLLGTRLRGLPRLRLIGRQRLGEVGQDAAEKLGLVVRSLGRSAAHR